MAYDWDRVQEDELSFVTGEIIAVTGTSVIGIYSVFIIYFIGQEDERWWEGYIESNPHRRGFFPADYTKSIEKSETSSREFNPIQSQSEFGLKKWNPIQYKPAIQSGNPIRVPTSAPRSSLFSILKQKFISFRIPFISNTMNHRR